MDFSKYYLISTDVSLLYQLVKQLIHSKAQQSPLIQNSKQFLSNRAFLRLTLYYVFLAFARFLLTMLCPCGKGVRSQIWTRKTSLQPRTNLLVWRLKWGTSTCPCAPWQESYKLNLKNWSLVTVLKLLVILEHTLFPHRKENQPWLIFKVTSQVKHGWITEGIMP